MQRQLGLILSFAEFSQLPRGIDPLNPKLRVVWGTAFRFLPPPFANAYAKPLKAEYLGEHGTPAFDSNLVFLKAWAQLVAAGGSWGRVAGRIPELLQPFTSLLTSGELKQPAFSDWQDSARREGAVLHTHLLLWEVLGSLAEVDLLPAVFVPFEASLRRLLTERYDPPSGLFREFTEGGRFGLDSHLLLINSENDAPLAAMGMDRPSLYARLKGSPLWRGLPGVPIYPAYEAKDIALTTKIVGLRHYHDKFSWGWLAAEAARAAYLANDPQEAERILQRLNAAGESEDFLAEIYEEKKGAWRPARRWLYRSEAPFTWTAAKVIEAMEAGA
ncbi:MAG: hypothetical protein EOP11_14520 [Proteobacteria bacterium]|nr:MAG: hypothetical protein EOP11_14520 [Pseudomonadota bacterium]